MTDKRLLDQINSSPQPLRQYIHDLVARVDPAGEVAHRLLLEENVRALTISIGDARALLRKLVYEEGCPSKRIGAPDDSTTVCAFCEGELVRTEFDRRGNPIDPGTEPEYDHAADCVWPELESAAGRT